jgi:hypothetical protein
MSGIPTINAESEAILTRKYNVNRPTVGIVLRPGAKKHTIRLFITGRPPSPHGKAQGDHTLAWSAVSRCLEWTLEDVTLVEAAEKIDQIHSSLSAAFLSSFSSCHDLMERAITLHAYITSRCPKELLCPWITEYLMHYTYIRNLLPEASIVLEKNSGTLGEKEALKSLKNLEISLRSGQASLQQKDKIVDALSTLIDKKAVQASIKKSSGQITDRSLQQVLSFQIIGINDLLQSLPNVSRVFLNGAKEASLFSVEYSCLIPDDLLSDLATIILYPAGQKPTNVLFQMDKANIHRALSMLAKLAHADVRDLYGTLH